MSRFRYKGSVPRPVKMADGEVLSLKPGMEFESTNAAVAELKRQKLVAPLPEPKKLVDKPKAKKIEPEPKDLKSKTKKLTKKADESSEKKDKPGEKADSAVKESAGEEKKDEKESGGFSRSGK